MSVFTNYTVLYQRIYRQLKPQVTQGIGGEKPLQVYFFLNMIWSCVKCHSFVRSQTITTTVLCSVREWGKQFIFIFGCHWLCCCVKGWNVFVNFTGEMSNFMWWTLLRLNLYFIVHLTKFVLYNSLDIINSKFQVLKEW